MLELTDDPMTWVFTGDSITQGVLHTHDARSWVEHLQERVRWQLGRTTDVVINSGVSGWDAPLVLANADWLVGRFVPSVVSIALGMNDARWGPDGRERLRDSLGQLVLTSRSLGAQVVLHTPNTVATSALSIRGDLAAYADIVRELAAEHGVLLVDHARAWGVRFGAEEPIEWLNDPIHPNALGHQQMAQLTMEVLGLQSAAVSGAARAPARQIL